MIRTVMDRSVAPALMGVAQLRVSGNSSCCNNICTVLKTLSLPRTDTLVDSCFHSVSTDLAD
jgi:hypothetical protein